MPDAAFDVVLHATPGADAAPRLPMPPQVVTAGGPRLTSPRLVPIFFASDDAATVSAIGDFLSALGSTHYWSAVTREYGVGPASAKAPAVLADSENPPGVVDESAIRTWLASKLNTNDPMFGTPDANTLYALFYPPAVTITFGTSALVDAGAEGGVDAGQGSAFATSCVDFAGYHQAVELDVDHANQNVAFAVIPRCASFRGYTGLDVVTAVASHELIEGATDPFSSLDPAYVQIDAAHLYWGYILGGSTELADMCSQNVTSLTKFAELPYVVQRSWSNAAEAAGHDPCVPPLPGEVYFNSVPVLDTVTMSFGAAAVQVKAVYVPVGQSKAVDLDLFSDGPTSAPWSVDAVDLATLRGSPAELAFSFDRASGVNGDTIKMTIQVLAAAPSRRELFVVRSVLGKETHTWFGAVAN
jgi:hypothetical protein